MTDTRAVAALLESATELPKSDPRGSNLAAYLLAALDTVIHQQHTAVYVSTPITTGRALLEWRAGPGRGAVPESPSHRRFVAEMIRANTASVGPLVNYAERELGGPVIDPTRLGNVSGWSQPDYHEFWTKVVERYARLVVFADGWQFSVGCSLEYLAASRAQIRCLDSTLEELPRDRAIQLMRDAEGQLVAANLPTETHARVLDTLTRLPTQGVGTKP